MAAYFFQYAPNQRRVGLQAALINETLWLHGGVYINQDGLANATILPEPGKVNATTDFTIPSGPFLEWQANSPDVPNVAHGTMWSNLINRAWLFGGRSYADSSIANNVWRFEPERAGEQWTTLDAEINESSKRPTNGAGCNVPDIQRGFYLGGVVERDDGAPGLNEYLHLMHIFDTHNETMSTIQIPEYVPVVNQSMLWLNTGNEKGALVILGGLTEINGTLEVAPLTSIFIFDIASETWARQNVTDQIGLRAEDHKPGFEPSIGIPQKRYNACAAAGSARDRTSHNIYLLGGENGTQALSDAWVISLPSAVWIKLALPDTTNGPKADSSCILLNSRYVLMFGGCYHDWNPDRPCMSYSYDPLNYDIVMVSWQPYTYHINGYLVPDNISSIIGGDYLGNSPQRKPMFGNYCDPLLEHVFEPQNHRSNNNGPYFNPTSPMLVSILIGSPVVLAIVYVGILYIGKAINSKLGRNTIKKGWKPWVLRHPFLLFVLTQTACLIVLLVFLTKESQIPDLDPAHWSGGLESAGTWTGQRFSSRFIRAPGLQQPQQGLLSVYLDTGTSGEFNRKNFTIRFSFGAYWAFTYLPTLIAVLYGRVWKVIDDEVKRVDKFYRLRGGTSGKLSLCLDYHTFWAPLSIVQALLFRHWVVVISSTAFVLSSVVLPVIQNYAFVWEVYSGGTLDWPDTFSWGVALINPFWSAVLVALLSVTGVCAIVLVVLLHNYDTGLTEDPRGIASAIALLHGQDASSLGFAEDSDRQSLSGIRRDIDQRCFRLEATGSADLVLQQYQSTHQRNRLLKTLLLKLPFKGSLEALGQKLKALFKPPKQLIFQLKRDLEDHPHGFILRNEVFILWLIFLTLLLAYSIYIAVVMDKNAEAGAFNTAIPLSADLYLLVGIFAQSIADTLEQTIRAIAPFHALHQGYQPPRVLWTDYTRAIPIYEILLALQNKDFMLCLAFVATWATITYTVFLGSLQLSSSDYGATSFNSDVPPPPLQ